jgi:hypothetical protein
LERGIYTASTRPARETLGFSEADFFAEAEVV